MTMIGRVIEGFRIEEKLGEGGMGVVYRAKDTDLSRVVALKALHGELTRDPQLTERFLSEARTQAQLNHPNLATLYRLFQFEGTYFMAMEYVDGETFAQMIRRLGPVPQEKAIPLFKQALAGLGHAHHAGIIHRDIKPSNLMVNKDGIVKVMDFGIAKILGGRGLTATGVRLGTLYYMSPEQIRNQPLDIRTDIYALGITLYEMLTGRVPFDSDSDYDLMQQHVQKLPPSPRQYYPYLVPALEHVILEALEKDPAERFQTVEAFSRALDDAMTSKTMAAGAPALGAPTMATMPSPGYPSAPAASPAGIPVPGRPATPSSGYVAAQPPRAPSTPLPSPPPGRAIHPQTPSGGFASQPTVVAPTPIPGAPPSSQPPSRTPSGGYTDQATRVAQTSLPRYSADGFVPPGAPSGGYFAPPYVPSGATPVPGASPLPPYEQAAAPAQKNKLVPITLGVAAILVTVIVIILFISKRQNVGNLQVENLSTVSPSSPNATQPSTSQTAPSQGIAPSTELTTVPAQGTPDAAKSTEASAAETKQPKESQKSLTSSRSKSKAQQAASAAAAQQAALQQQQELERQRQLQQLLEQQKQEEQRRLAAEAEARKKAEMEQSLRLKTFRVAHGHGRGFEQNCMGTLTLSKTRASFKPDSGNHSFDVPAEDVKEGKKNSGFWSTPSFHIRLKNGENFNFARVGPDNRLISPMEILVHMNEVMPPSMKR